MNQDQGQPTYNPALYDPNNNQGQYVQQGVPLQQYQQQPMQQYPHQPVYQQPQQPVQLFSQQPQFQAMAINVNPNQPNLEPIISQLIQFQGNQRCWKNVSMVLLILSCISAIFNFISRSYFGGVIALIGILVWLFWYKSTKLGEESISFKRYEELNEAIIYMHRCILLQFFELGVNFVFLIVLIVIYAKYDEDKEKNGDKIKKFLLIFGVIGTIVTLIIQILFILAARRLKQNDIQIKQLLVQYGAMKSDNIQ